MACACWAPIPDTLVSQGTAFEAPRNAVLGKPVQAQARRSPSPMVSTSNVMPLASTRIVSTSGKMSIVRHSSAPCVRIPKEYTEMTQERIRIHSADQLEVIADPMPAGRGPTWDHDSGRLFWLDSYDPHLYYLDSEGFIQQHVLPAMVGSLAVIDDSKVLLALNRVIRIPSSHP